MASTGRLRIGIETADRRTFASALDWPGWSRAGRDEAAALAALAGAAWRYAAVAERPGLDVGLDWVVPTDVVERFPGTATTAFGAPDVVFAPDRRPVDATEAARLAAISDPG